MNVSKRMRMLDEFDRTNIGSYDGNAGWSSLVARWAHNPKVGGSNPLPATNGRFWEKPGSDLFSWAYIQAASASMFQFTVVLRVLVPSLEQSWNRFPKTASSKTLPASRTS